jgi:hypothetical protein
MRERGGREGKEEERGEERGGERGKRGGRGGRERGIYFWYIFYPFLYKKELVTLNNTFLQILLRERGVTAAVWTVSQRTSPALFWSTIKNTKNWMLSICGMFFVGAVAGLTD